MLQNFSTHPEPNRNILLCKSKSNRRDSFLTCSRLKQKNCLTLFFVPAAFVSSSIFLPANSIFPEILKKNGRAAVYKTFSKQFEQFKAVERRANLHNQKVGKISVGFSLFTLKNVWKRFFFVLTTISCKYSKGFKSNDGLCFKNML